MTKNFVFEVKKSPGKSLGVEVDAIPLVLKKTKLNPAFEGFERVCEEISEIRSASNELDRSLALREIAEALVEAGKDTVFEILSGETSLKLYLAFKYPHKFKMEFREGEILKWKGESFRVPKVFKYPEILFYEFLYPLCGQYSIPECHVMENDIVFDVGAHFGFFSCHALQKGAKEIHAFEPNPRVFEILKRHVELWNRDKIKPHCLALSSSEREEILRIPKGKELYGWATLKEIEEEKEDPKVRTTARNSFQIKVKTKTIDGFVREMELERVDFIKIDTEGSEMEIIKGARETIEKFRPRMAIAAYHFPEDRKKIPELVLSIRSDYRFRLVNKGEEVLFFF